MERLRQSKLMRAICFFMAISIFLVSCDPHGDIVANKVIDKQTDKILDEYKGRMTQVELEKFKQSATAIKAHMLKQRSMGITLSRKDVANFIYKMNVDDGTIPESNDAEREKFAKFVEVTTWGGDQKGIINKLVEEKFFNAEMGNIMQDARLKLDSNKGVSPSQANTILDDIRNMPAVQKLSDKEQVAFQKALDGAESVAYYENNNTELKTRGWCEECNWTLHWVELLLSILVTAAAWFLGVITLGLSTLLTSTVLVTVWAATWTLVCIFVWCADAEPCPSGQNPVCEGSFNFDSSIPACTNSSFPSDAFEFGNCIYIPKPSNGVCNSGTPAGVNCLLECFNVRPQKNSNGAWQLPFNCQ